MRIMLITRSQLYFILACFICGLLCGCTISMLYAARTIDEKVITLETLYSEISEKDVRITKLEESLKQQRSQIVREVKIGIDIKDPYLKLKLSDAIKALVIDLIGTEVSNLEPQLIRNIIDQRLLEINDVTYILSLQYLMLSESMYMEIHVATVAQ